MRFQLAAVAALALAVTSTPAAPHHSFAMFDIPIFIRTLVNTILFLVIAVFIGIQLVSKDASGKDVEWSMEMGAPMYLYARGWRPGSLKAGMEVSVTLNPLRNGKPGGVVREVTTADGKPIGTNT